MNGVLHIDMKVLTYSFSIRMLDDTNKLSKCVQIARLYLEVSARFQICHQCKCLLNSFTSSFLGWWCSECWGFYKQGFIFGHQQPSWGSKLTVQGLLFWVQRNIFLFHFRKKLDSALYFFFSRSVMQGFWIWKEDFWKLHFDIMTFLKLNNARLETSKGLCSFHRSFKKFSMVIHCLASA
jgi:hypothetical protein